MMKTIRRLHKISFIVSLSLSKAKASLKLGFDKLNLTSVFFYDYGIEEKRCNEFSNVEIFELISI